MRRLLLLLSSIPVILLAQAARVPQSTSSTGPASGRWIVRADFYGTPRDFSMSLDQQGDNVTGVFASRKLEGTLSDGSLHFVAKDDQGGTVECKASLKNNTMSGSLVFTNPDDPTHPVTHQFTAEAVPERRPGPPQRYEFTPTTFYRQFSALNKPVLTVWPGDTIHTTTVDAGGTDEKGVRRVLGGNPETGPFYIQTAAPGDTLVVHFTRTSPESRLGH